MHCTALKVGLGVAPGKSCTLLNASGWLLGAGSLYTNYTPLELQPGPTYNHTYAHNL